MPLSESDIRSAINDQLRPNRKSETKCPCPSDDGYIREVFPLDNFFIMEKGGECFRVPYTISNNEVTLGKTRIPVMQEWVPKKQSGILRGAKKALLGKEEK